MNTFATIIVKNSNKAAAQELLGIEFFSIHLKKNLRNYWASSGSFLTSEYDAMMASDLVYAVNTEDDFYTAISNLDMTRIVVEDE